MISVTVLTKNSQATLYKTLEALSSFPEVIVYDSGSTDHTLSIAESFPNVMIHRGIFQGFGPTHNAASACARNDWIFCVDSDEIPSAALVEEIHALHLNPAYIYEIPRHNFFNGRWIKWCGGWYPDPVRRIYNRKKTQFSEDAVHEKIMLGDLKVVSLFSPLYHVPYRSIDDFLSKMQTYSSLFAEQNRKRKPPSLCKAVMHSWFAFFKSYILKRGFLGGKEGFIISAYNGHVAFYKYLKLMGSYFKSDIF